TSWGGGGGFGWIRASGRFARTDRRAVGRQTMLDDVLHIHPQTPLQHFPRREGLQLENGSPAGGFFLLSGNALRRPRPPGRAMSKGDMVVGPAPRDKGGPAPGPKPDVAGGASGLGRCLEPTRPGVWRGGVYADGELSPKRGL
ncbi:MAG: hypothetical protein QW544_02540, partial [Candidatus Caldarchaeum sp.]